MTGFAEKLRCALVIARRDFVAVVFSKTFIFFLIGPAFPLVVGGLAGNIGAKVQQNVERPTIGLAMSAQDNKRMLAAREELDGRMAGGLPDMIELAAAAQTSLSEAGRKSRDRPILHSAAMRIASACRQAAIEPASIAA